MTEKHRKRVFLLDGHGLAYRAFYAMISRPLRTSGGENTSVPYGVTRLTLKLLNEHGPDYLGFVFDSGRETFRHDIYPAYKGTRQKMDETDADEFRRAMGRVLQILEALRIPAVSVEGYEADDVIGALAKQAAERGLEAVIVSGDTDFYQLIGPGICVIEPGRGGRTVIEPQWVDVEAATERMGVPPHEVIDYLALVGDPSDNIPGVRGIGPKTAEGLLKRYGRLETILEHVDEIDSKRARQALKAQAEEARLSKMLATIRTDAPVSLDLEALEVREPDREKLRALFVQLEFHTLLREAAAISAEKASYRIIDSADEIPRLSEEIQRSGRAALEVVMDAVGPRGGAPVGLALSLKPGRAVYLPLNHSDGPNLPPLDSEGMKALSETLSSPRVEKIGHDLKRAVLSLRAAGVEVSDPFTDAMLLSYCLDPARRQHELDALVIERLGRRLRSSAEILQRGQSFSDLAPEDLKTYAAERADMALRLSDGLLPDLDRYGERRLYEEIEAPLLPVLADMEWIGVGIDQAVLDAMSLDLEKKLDLARDRIYRLAGGVFNIDSVIMLREVLFERLKLPVVRRTKTGPSTDADVLSELAARGHELPERLLEYREAAKLKSTYVDALRERISPETGRLHTSFNQAATATGRLSSSEPNLQNIPARTPLGASIRKAFVAEKGFKLLTADYSQIELRILAHMSKDPVFLEAFRSGRDIHRETAALVFRAALPEVSPHMRGMAKTVNYATLYGQGAPSLARMIGVPQEEASKFIEGYFERFPSIRSYLDGQIDRAVKEGYVETLFGRRRYVPELRSKNPGVRGFGRRVAQNSPIQGSAADIIKLAMIRIHRRLSTEGRRSRMLLQVHDELLFEAWEEELEALSELVGEEMGHAAALDVPLVAEIGWGKSWYEAKKGEGL